MGTKRKNKTNKLSSRPARIRSQQQILVQQKKILLFQLFVVTGNWYKKLLFFERINLTKVWTRELKWDLPRHSLDHWSGYNFPFENDWTDWNFLFPNEQISTGEVSEESSCGLREALEVLKVIKYKTFHSNQPKPKTFRNRGWYSPKILSLLEINE